MKSNTLFKAGMFFVGLFLLPGSLMAAHHEEAEPQPQPQQQAVAQLLTFCSLNEGKTMEDAAALGPMWGRFFKKQDMAPVQGVDYGGDLELKYDTILLNFYVNIIQKLVSHQRNSVLAPRYRAVFIKIFTDLYDRADNDFRK